MIDDEHFGEYIDFRRYILGFQLDQGISGYCTLNLYSGDLFKHVWVYCNFLLHFVCH